MRIYQWLACSLVAADSFPKGVLDFFVQNKEDLTNLPTLLEELKATDNAKESEPQIQDLKKQLDDMLVGLVSNQTEIKSLKNEIDAVMGRVLHLETFVNLTEKVKKRYQVKVNALVDLLSKMGGWEALFNPLSTAEEEADN